MFLLVDCDRRPAGQTDTTEYRDARTHLKTMRTLVIVVEEVVVFFRGFKNML